MAVTPELRQQIISWLVEFLARTGLQHELREVASFGALPLYWDVGGCMALRPDGEVVAVYWSKPEASFQRAEARFALAALVTGSAEHPELQALLPKRPPGAADCANCEGQGLLADGAICGQCSGLGFGG